MSDTVNTYNVTFTKDEVLVLLEFFGRFQDTDQFMLQNNAEFVAFSKLSGQLAKMLVEPFQSDHMTQVEAARARLGDGYEGVAPGVTP
jgi:hypothetical protein